MGETMPAWIHEIHGELFRVLYLLGRAMAEADMAQAVKTTDRMIALTEKLRAELLEHWACLDEQEMTRCLLCLQAQKTTLKINEKESGK